MRVGVKGGARSICVFHNHDLIVHDGCTSRKGIDTPRVLAFPFHIRRSLIKSFPGFLLEKPLLRHKQLTPEEQSAKEQRDGEIPFARMLQHRIRYFTDGAVIGSRIFVDEAFVNSRTRFGPKRNSGARKMRGNASAASLLI
jgi:hypothetical protein